jgi:hypothetical protein
MKSWSPACVRRARFPSAWHQYSCHFASSAWLPIDPMIMVCLRKEHLVSVIAKAFFSKECEPCLSVSKLP